MFVLDALNVLRQFAAKKITSTGVFRRLDLALAGSAPFIPEEWDPLVDIILERGELGLEEILSILSEHGTLPFGKNPSALSC